MNKDQVKGRMEEAKGGVKQGLGKAVGSTKMQNEGAHDKAAGKTKAAAGDAMKKVKDHVNRT